MEIIIPILLALTVVAGFLLASRIYHLDKHYFLYQLTAASAIGASILAFIEYEISRQTLVGSVEKLASIHIITVSTTLYIAITSVWIFTNPYPKDKNPLVNRALLGINSLVLLCIFICEISGHHFISSLHHNGMIWQYNLSYDGFMKKVFLCWLTAQGISPFIGLFLFYHNCGKEKIKQWILGIILASAILFSTMFILFLVNSLGQQKGIFCISPWIMIGCAIYAYSYTNFKLFTVSPINALDNILESMSNLLAIADLNFKITYINKAAREELKLPADVIPTMSFHDIAKKFDASDWAQELDKIKSLTAGKQYSTELELKHQGKALYYQMTFSPIYNHNQVKTGYLAIANNCTERKKTALQLQQYNYDLKQSNMELERFAYIASHDLKTPLRSVISFLNLVQRHVKENYEDPTIDEFLDYAVNGANQMNHLIQDVLEFSKIQRDTQLKNEPVNLNEAVRAVCQVLSTMIAEKKAAIHLDHLPTIQGDRSRMIQLFQNLIENGIKYNTSPYPEIIISYSEQEEHHQITIKDNGIGIDETYSEQIFEMFKRLHRPCEYEGTGIGLAICKKIVIQCNGNIRLASKEGEGSRFIITLPKSGAISFRRKQKLHPAALPASVD